MTRPKTIPTTTQTAVRTRSQGLCEGCGQHPATELHHRRYRSRGGTHEVSNLLHLCGSGNHTGCHGKAHTGAGEVLGWSVESGIAPPAHYPLTYRGVRALLDDDGNVHTGSVVF